MEREYWFVILSAILYGTMTVGGQFFINAGLSIYEISLYPAIFISFILLPVVLTKRKYLIKREMFSFFIFYGFITALLALTEFGGIVFGVPVAIVALLLYSQPIWTIVFGKLILKEQITSIKIIAIVSALAGVIILLKPWNIESVITARGIISSLLGGVFLSLWIIWGRISGINKQNYITTTIGYMGFSAIWLLVLWPFVAFFIHEPTIIRLSTSFETQNWLFLAFFAIMAHMVPYFFFYKGVQKVNSSTAGIILLLEPISAAILAAILFAQPIDLDLLYGGTLILLSNYLLISKDRIPA
ncbi:hypothetical protein METP3_00801 [Methanosarcinales archaeon]|nr:hypothetical protein METP3_00801 [Methanosarcinales archaeon]